MFNPALAKYYHMKQKQISKQMKENYEHILNKMSAEEREWAENFELMEYAIERGRADVAISIAKKLHPTISKDTVSKIKEEITVKTRCNPVRAEAHNRSAAKQRKSSRTVPEGMYDASDWVKQKFGFDHQTGETFELVTSTNPEDALIQALDAAAAHGVSLDEFVNNPKYHTPERKAGRPKQIKE